MTSMAGPQIRIVERRAIYLTTCDSCGLDILPGSPLILAYVPRRTRADKRYRLCSICVP